LGSILAALSSPLFVFIEGQLHVKEEQQLYNKVMAAKEDN